jgi:UDP-3-O-[3-hydroxymyristoyl] N-acetylglucosamine deacetylase
MDRSEAVVRRHSTRPQRTILRPACVEGVGLLTGTPVQLRFVPAPPGTGVVFSRVDLPGRPRIAAHVSNVTGTHRRTTLGSAPAQVTLVEHVLAALAGLKIDNCTVEIDAVEPPGLDGSANGFVQALVKAGICDQPARRGIWCADEPVTVQAGNATLTLHPPIPGHDPELAMTYFLDYGPWSPLSRQVYTHTITPGVFIGHIASCRTFLLEAEAEELRRQGLGVNTSPQDLLVFGPRGPIDNELRFANEPARHKVLDMIGDLSLLGADLCGHVIACRSGHPLNVELAQAVNQMMARALGNVAA